MTYYELRQKHNWLGKTRWNTIAFYDTEQQMKDAFSTISNTKKDNYKMFKVTEEEVNEWTMGDRI